MLMKLCLLIVLNSLFANGGNILFLATIKSPSHHFWNNAIVTELAKRGHNITVISLATDKNPPPGVHQILIEETETTNKETAKEIVSSAAPESFWSELLLLQHHAIEHCECTTTTNGFKTLLNYPDDFKVDLVIHDYTGGPCFLPFVHKFKYPPLIGVTTYTNPSFTNQIIGGHQYYGYIPIHALFYDDNMNFWQRFRNFLLYMVEYGYRQKIVIPTVNKIVQERFGAGIPPVEDIEKKTAFVFVNTNPTMDYMAPLPENVIPVAGLHIKDPKPIPKDLKAFIDSSKNGVVLFSLGTNFLSTYMPKSKQQIFLDVFNELPNYNFLWKFETNISSADLPKNVQIHSWLPISDLLVDPKVKAIYFHGGLLTTQETIWRGVPSVIMPFGLDQNQNLIKLKRLGMAEGIDYYHSLNRQNVKDALLKVLEDPSYRKNAEKWSSLFRDQKEKPLDRAVWWIEWTLRNPNCSHLTSPVHRLGFIAANAYDIIAAVLVGITVFLFMFVKIVCACRSGRQGERPVNLTSGGFQGPIDGGYNSLTDAGTTTLYSLTSKWSEPYFDAMIQKNVTALVGKSAYLSCKVRNLGNKTVSWIRHRDVHILTVGSYTYTSDQRFQATYHKDTDDWTLQIKWAQKRDAGMYECQISTVPIRSFFVNLNVVVPTAAILGSPDLHVDKGSTINLTCAVKYSPEPPAYIFWYHHDEVISYDSTRGGVSVITEKGDVTTSYLLIQNADLADSGKYSCSPSNADVASMDMSLVRIKLKAEKDENVGQTTLDCGTPAQSCRLNVINMELDQ
ncbi:UDP-glucosyltransferase 2 [Pseudolycoriella hygida]|uniref:UDP-glucosyltransferase 2 n=1 Tax=Pseudolycoriella hygida TaxID=35572 RepID=A0A9Q0MQI1_9DIPT|nr:UDP-glucosyltransferase 2 [Pseudolycoriella hygida]